MRMVAGPGSSDAAAPALVASTGQFASDMNLADGSPARYSYCCVLLAFVNLVLLRDLRYFLYSYYRFAH